MAFHLQPDPPGTADDWDIWIQPDGTRHLWESGAWQLIATDPGFVAAGGTTGQRLAKAGVAFGQTGWADAAGGIAIIHEQTTAAATWTVQHRLMTRFVGVTVIDPSRGNMIMIPEIVYQNNLSCQLRFARAVTGTALIRR